MHDECKPSNKGKLNIHMENIMLPACAWLYTHKGHQGYPDNLEMQGVPQIHL